MKTAGVEGVRCLRSVRRIPTPSGSLQLSNNPLILVGYHAVMDHSFGSDTLRAAASARDALVTARRSRDERGMAAFARDALFDEALLGALKARVAELKLAAK